MLSTAASTTEAEIRSFIGPTVAADVDLNSLTKLDLSNLGLSSIPNDIHEFLPNLSILFLSNNNFSELPAVIGKCLNLQMVAFKDNGMKTIHPDALQSQLRWLILTNNALTAIPDSIGRCKKLQKLMLSGNQLTELPQTIKECQALELVRLASNHLTEPPLCVLELPRLAWIGLSDNPFLPPLSTMDQELPQFTDWDIRSDEEYDLILSKSPILGQGAGGVTRKVTTTVSDKSRKLVVAVKSSTNHQMTSDGLPHMERQVNKAVAKLTNPSFVQILGQTIKGDLVMEYLEDHRALALPPSMETCSRDVYTSDSLDAVDDVVKMMTQLLDALVELHAVGICHGDFYAHNILVRSGYPARLTDFGAAFHYDIKAPYGKFVQASELRAFGVFVQEVAGSNRLLENLVKQCLASNAEMANVRIWWKQQLLKLMSIAFDDTLESGVKEQ